MYSFAKHYRPLIRISSHTRLSEQLLLISSNRTSFVRAEMRAVQPRGAPRANTTRGRPRPLSHRSREHADDDGDEPADVHGQPGQQGDDQRLQEELVVRSA